MKKWILYRLFFPGLSLLGSGLSVEGQDSLKQPAAFSWKAYVEAYYSYDFNRPDNHLKPSFFYNHNRHNEFSINLTLVSLGYADSSKRANLGLMAGTYPQYNLAAEPELLRLFYEANIGIRLSSQKELWLDAGILPSHIGFESAVGKDCWTATRSIAAENSPYYEAGVRLSYKSKNAKWYLAGLVLNGWQRIKRPDGNSTPALGTQVTFMPTNKLTLNHSMFIGNDKPDSAKQWRYFNNLYVIWQLSNSWSLTAGFDIGLEQKASGSSDFHSWYAPLLLLRYQKNGWAATARAEYYSDRQAVIIPAVNGNALQSSGYTLTIDRTLYSSVLLRIEGRSLHNKYPYFAKGQATKRSIAFMTSTLSISF